MIRQKIGEYEKRLRAFYEKYERVLIPALLVFGFIVDFITFRSLKYSTTFLILGIYAVIALAAIFYINIYDGRLVEAPKAWLRNLRVFMPLVVQFTFGALLSASLIFYWFSGAFSVSWPIMVILVILMTSNEVFRHYYLKPVVQFSVFAFAIFSYLSILLPFLFNSLESKFFILAGMISALLVFGALALLFRFSPQIKRIRVAGSVLLVFAGFNVLYFFNIIPPIPLSIREAGAYYDVRRAGGEYELRREEESFLGKFLPGQTLYLDKSQRIYVYTAIFAPAKVRTTIYHVWYLYDEDSKQWILRNRLFFSINGGRNDGFRGYSYKTNLVPGKWRVSVETERGQVLGRIPFTLK